MDEGLRNALQKQKPPNSPLSFDDSGSSKSPSLGFFKPVNLKDDTLCVTSKMPPRETTIYSSKLKIQSSIRLVPVLLELVLPSNLVGPTLRALLMW